MLHTCKSCGEAWSGEYILLHLSQFLQNKQSNVLTIRRCPNCIKPIGIPDYSTQRGLARAFIRLLDNGYYIGVRMFRAGKQPMSRSVTEVYNALHA